MSTDAQNTRTPLLPDMMDADDRRDLLTAMISTLQYALMNERYLSNVEDKEIYEYGEMMKRLV